MKTMSFKELLKQYKAILDELLVDDPLEVNTALMFRSALIAMIKDLTDKQFTQFLKVDANFTDKIDDIIKENDGFADFINDKSALIFYEIQTRRLVA